MAWDFPNAPSEGQQFTPVAGGPTYVYRAPAWELVTVSGVSISDTPPANPLVGQEWFESDSGNTFVWYSDGNTSQWVQTNGTGLLQTAPTGRNRIVNGAMQISQELTLGNTYTAMSSYIADQWYITFSTTGAPAFALATDIGGDVVNYIVLNNTTADAAIAATDYYRVGQMVEGKRIADFRWGKTGAKPAILRFRATSTILGTFSVSIQAGGSTFVKNLTFTATSVWQEFVVPIPALTTGTVPTDYTTGLALFFTVMAGSTYLAPVDGAWNSGGFMAAAGVSNWMSAIGQTFSVANVGFYLDPSNTGVAPRWEAPDEAQELIACKRYWQPAYTIFNGNVTSTAAYYATGSIAVAMRINTPAFAGVNGTNSAFPATVGVAPVMASPSQMYDYRTANATSYGVFSTNWNLNARM